MKTTRSISSVTHLDSINWQLVVFTLCDRFLLPNNQLTGLYSLMFYNVIAYCFNYGREVREMITESERHLSVRLSSRSSVRHLAISSTNVCYYQLIHSMQYDCRE